jgi:hypothetical protein
MREAEAVVRDLSLHARDDLLHTDEKSASEETHGHFS